MENKKDRIRTIKSLIKGLDLPDGAVIGFGSDIEIESRKIPTPIPTLNALCGGGFPVGKFTCISGPPGTSKSTLCLHWVAHIQATTDRVCCWIDSENSFDSAWASKLGVNVNELLLVTNLRSLEEYLNVFNRVVNSDLAGAIVVDSVGAMAPKGEIEDKKGVTRRLEDDTMGLQARKMSQFFRINTSCVSRHGVAVVMIAQVYSNINAYGGIWEVKGGNAFKHATHLRIMTRRSKSKEIERDVLMPDGKVIKLPVGFDMHVKIDKTRQSETEGQSIVLPFSYGLGINVAKATVLTAIAYDIIQQAGAWFNWNGEKWQGKQTVIDYFTDNPESYTLLVEQLEQEAVDDILGALEETKTKESII